MANAILDIIEHGLIKPPAKLKAMSCRFSAEATLLDDGCIQLADQVFATIDVAMEAVISQRAPAISDSLPAGNAWKFWGFYCKDRGSWTPIEHLYAQHLSLQKDRSIRTSDTHPLRIDCLLVPECSGLIGLTFCPGKKTSSIYGGDWDRSLEKDLSQIDAWGASLLITLLESNEFSVLGIPDFSESIKKQHFAWIQLPIKDMSIPDQTFETAWQSVGPEIHSRLNRGERIVIHCRGGIGRTGMLAARILVERGILPTNAIGNVRAVRENSIETFAQEEYVTHQLWKR